MEKVYAKCFGGYNMIIAGKKNILFLLNKFIIYLFI